MAQAVVGLVAGGGSDQLDEPVSFLFVGFVVDDRAIINDLFERSMLDCILTIGISFARGIGPQFGINRWDSGQGRIFRIEDAQYKCNDSSGNRPSANFPFETTIPWYLPEE